MHRLYSALLICSGRGNHLTRVHSIRGARPGHLFMLLPRRGWHASGHMEGPKIRINKPQLLFQDTIDNSTASFRCRLKHKDNAIADYDESSSEHPYKYELDNLLFLEKQLSVEESREEPANISHLPSDVQFIDDEPGLSELCDHLDEVSEMAVDLEHHSLRSYQGFTCLIQLATRERLVVIDALALRHVLYKLNKPFTDPSKVKVFHASSNDLLWLQKDFGVFLLNLFDTYHACHLLDSPNSLNYLLGVYCDVKKSTSYGRHTDWRLRPLTDSMLRYSSTDVKYLLPIYDKIRNALWKVSGDHSLTLEVLERGKKDCHRVYSKPVNKPDPLEQYRRRDGASILSPRQMKLLEDLYSWRDKAARELDESPIFVLPFHSLCKLAIRIPLDQKQLIRFIPKHSFAAKECCGEILDILSSV